ncbi:hypothetical protein KIW84_013061 [Lathyrus oleraceus]|uniref:Uncharacterized protein n=1 Tax=Pisum sativum TaxID=3888 RepID=A0A9D5BJJ6_PEA|nr:hypothetical protein KIW84_013061 [Pisum sativum]
MKCYFYAVVDIMASKRGRVTRGSSSRTTLTPNALNFPNLKFLSEANADKYLKLVDYHIETNKTIGLESYANVAFSDVDSYTSYIRGKYIDYSSSAINSLLNFQPLPVCALKTYRYEHHVINEAMAQEILGVFCRPEAEWVIERGIAM